MLVEEFIEENPNHKGSLAFLLTSDEEGPAVNGTVKVVEHLQNDNVDIDYCLVGEPSSTNAVGDVIKNGQTWITVCAFNRDWQARSCRLSTSSRQSNP